MNDQQVYITITHINEFSGYELFRPGMRVILKKDTDNIYDDEAIAVYSEHGAKLGYVPNSVRTVARGTHSAGYVYNLFGNEITCTVCFVTESEAIGCFNKGTE